MKTPRRGWLIPASLFGVPLAAALWFGVAQAADVSAWSRLLHDSQLAPAWLLSLWVGVASTLLATALALVIVTHSVDTPAWTRLQAGLGAMLALPHAAFAIGLALLCMPSGFMARALALLTHWSEPPDIATVQDPWGLALVAGLVLKELPFLLWNIAAQLRRAGQGAEIAKQQQIAATLGYSRRSTWWRVLWPQLLPRLAWPLLAVWAYSLTVVDMALVLGPTRPPTLAALAWQWLLDADTAVNRQGAAAALLLAGCVALGATAAVMALRALHPMLRRRWTRGDRPASRATASSLLGRVLGIVYAAVAAALVFVSFAGVWRFPALWPSPWVLQNWQAALHSGATWWTTVTLALAASATGLVLAVAWLETTPPRWDARATPAVFATLLVPGVLLAAGLYQLALQLDLDGRWSGVWLAHSLITAPYVLVTLAPAYRGLDARYAQTAHALGRGHAAFLWHVKWPMLVAPLAAAFAVGFAVSVTQFLSTQFVGAGRHATLTTEALTLASGGQRGLAAAFALLQALLPATVFALAWALGHAQAQRLRADPLPRRVAHA